MQAPVPGNELERLAALYRYDVLDHAMQAELESIVHLAVTVTGASIGMVNLIDFDRQWQLCAVGVAMHETRREDSLCQWVITDTKTVHVPNCSSDERFRTSPYVTGELGNVRMYASAPLVTSEGYSIGTLCTADTREFSLADPQIDGLTRLAKQLMASVELRRYSKLLDRANDELNAFAGMVAHDLRGPLTTMSGYAQILQTSLIPDDPMNEMADRLRESITRMGTVIDDVLNHARSGQQVTEPEPVRLDLVANVAVENLRSLIEERNAKVFIADLPVIEGDVVGLAQLFQNLIANAIEHGPINATTTVRITAAPVGDQYAVLVDDNGTGIAPDDRSNIFDAYKSRNRESRGFGLGLATCKRIAERHGGSITIEEGPGGGARFRILLPRRQSVLRLDPEKVAPVSQPYL